MAKKITLQDVAKLAGVSVPLASKVLNGRECRLSEEKRRGILEAAGELGYKTKNAFRFPQSRGGVKTLAFLQPNLDFGFFQNLANEVSREAYGKGYRLLLLNTNEDPAEERRCLAYCADHRVDGILVNPCDNQENLDIFENIRSAGLPMAFVDRSIYSLNCPAVTSDNAHAAGLLTQALIGRGHEKILFLFHGEVLYTSVTKERYEGYVAAMEAQSLRPAKELVFSHRPLEYQPIMDLEKFTAILLSTSADIYKLREIMAQTGAGDAAWELGVFDEFSVPYNQPVLDSLFRFIHPDVLVMEQDVPEMARQAVGVLDRAIRSGGDAPPAAGRIVVPCKMQNLARQHPVIAPRG